MLKILVLIDEYARQCLALHVPRQIRSNDVIDGLADAMLELSPTADFRLQ